MWIFFDILTQSCFNNIISEGEQPAIHQPDLDAPEVDPYSPEGVFGLWVKDIQLETPQFEALSDRALREKLEGELSNPKIKPDKRDEIIAALGVLRVQEHHNRWLPGYVTAAQELNRIIRTSLQPYERDREMLQGVRQEELDHLTHTGIGENLNRAIDHIVQRTSQSIM